MAKRKKQADTKPEAATRPSNKGIKRLIGETEAPEGRGPFGSPTPGATQTEGAKDIEAVLDREPETPEGRDPEAIRERRDRLRDAETLDAAGDAIADVIELDPDELMPDEPEEEDDGDEGDEGEPEGDAARLEFSDEELDSLVSVKVDGEDVKIPLREALAGAMRQAAFTKKTQALAEERREVSAIRDQATELADSYARRLEVLQRAGIAMTPQQREAVEAAWKQANDELDALRAHALSERLPEEGRKLAEALEWTTDEEAEAGKQALADAAFAYGYTPEDLSGVTDHRVLLILDDARKWREAQAGLSDAKDAARSGRRKSSTLQPGTRKGKGDRSKREARRRRERLAATGSLLDGARAIETLIK